ncbi:MAG TPA: recombinase family protein [Candidatus Acidoferrales bacterium]|jgi:DNA invertase Pin-like site-specific DNA recombinase|nr:recombinase family protein [Candidatus Acidoferrales bacterium]
MKNAIELIRVSTEQQAGEDRAGIPAQREANKRTVATYGLHVVRSVAIVDVSGTAVLSSPEMQTLLKLMESPDIHGVVTKEFSRLIRPEKFTDYALLQHFIDTNTVLYLPDGPIDLTSKTGRLLGTIRAAMAGMERSDIIERMQDAKESMRKAGKHPGGDSSLPYGVSYSPDAGWHYTSEAAKVRDAFSLFLGGTVSFTEIALRLNIPRTNVRLILQNPIYTGWRVYDRKRDPSPSGYVPRPDGRQGYRRKMLRYPEEVIRVRVLDPLISEQDFSRVQQLIELRRQEHWSGRKDTPRRYTYNGFLTCGDCSSLLYTHTSKQEFYQCKSRHPRERRRREHLAMGPCSNGYMLRKKLEPKIDRLLGEKLRDLGFLSCVLDAYNAERARVSAPLGTERSAIVSQLETLKAKKQRVLEAFFEGVIDKSERDSRFLEINRDCGAYERLSMEAVNPTPPLTMQSLQSCLEPFAEWEYLDRDDKRALLALVCPQIKVSRYIVKSIGLNLGWPLPGGDNGSHSKTAA